MKDSFGRNINYLRISITDLCNLRCRYCMPEDGVFKLGHEEVMTIEEMVEIAEVFVSLGIDKIRLTGGEPLVKRGILKIVEGIGKLPIKDFAMTTNGVLLDKYAKDLKKLGLDRVNISLDTLDSKKYSYITRGGDIEDVFKGIEKVREVGLTPIKINSVLIVGFNEDEIEDLVAWTKDEEIDIRFIELMPIGHARNYENRAFIPNSLVLDSVEELYAVGRIDPSSPASYYKLPEAKGRVGLINPISCKFCEDCNRIRLTSQGKLKLCLHSNREIDLLKPLRAGEDMEELILNAISEKPEAHHLEDGDYVSKGMYEIGG